MLLCKNFPADRLSSHPNPPERLKVGIRRPKTCFMTHPLNICADNKFFCCRAPLAAAAKETAPLAVPNNSPLSQVQQPQV